MIDLNDLQEKGEGAVDIVKAVGIKAEMDKNGLPIVTAHSTKQICTLDELVRTGEWDPSVWEVDRAKSNVWHQMSGANGLIPLFQITAFMRRRLVPPAVLEEVFRKGVKAFYAGLKVDVGPTKKTMNGIMVEFAAPDLHIGKLAWGDETGHGHWDCNLAVAAWKAAFIDLVKRAPEAEEAWLPLGHDFFNVDNDQGTTTAGTPQDEDGRWQKTFIIGVELAKWTIGLLRKKYPKVKVQIIRGNHDVQRSFYLGVVIEEFARQAKGVTVDNLPTNRKYYEWGETGIGMTHAYKLNDKRLAEVCQFEGREIWGRVKRFEVHVGHKHIEETVMVGGIKIRRIPTLCPPDAWHADSAYVMAGQAAQAFVYDQIGLQTVLNHYPNPKLFEK